MRPFQKNATCCCRGAGRSVTRRRTSRPPESRIETVSDVLLAQLERDRARAGRAVADRRDERVNLGADDRAGLELERLGVDERRSGRDQQHEDERGGQEAGQAADCTALQATAFRGSRAARAAPPRRRGRARPRTADRAAARRGRCCRPRSRPARPRARTPAGPREPRSATSAATTTAPSSSRPASAELDGRCDRRVRHGGDADAETRDRMVERRLDRVVDARRHRRPGHVEHVAAQRGERARDRGAERQARSRPGRAARGDHTPTSSATVGDAERDEADCENDGTSPSQSATAAEQRRRPHRARRATARRRPARRRSRRRGTARSRRVVEDRVDAVVPAAHDRARRSPAVDVARQVLHAARRREPDAERRELDDEQPRSSRSATAAARARARAGRTGARRAEQAVAPARGSSLQSSETPIHATSERERPRDEPELAPAARAATASASAAPRDDDVQRHEQPPVRRADVDVDRAPARRRARARRSAHGTRTNSAASARPATAPTPATTAYRPACPSGASQSARISAAGGPEQRARRARRRQRGATIASARPSAAAAPATRASVAHATTTSAFAA